MLLRAYVALDVLNCATRLLDFLRRGFGRVLGYVKLVRELVQLVEGGGIHRLALRHCYSLARYAPVALSRREHLDDALTRDARRLP
jgi:hypothetical protein